MLLIGSILVIIFVAPSLAPTASPFSSIRPITPITPIKPIFSNSWSSESLTEFLYSGKN
jgi:hypothetical protein